MNPQRQQALLEHRTRIKHAAKIMYGVTVTYAHVNVTVVTEDIKNQETRLDLNSIRQAISDYFERGITEGTDFEQIINDLYDVVAELYPERDIEVIIDDTNENFTVTRIFNTTKPVNNLAI